MLTPTNIRLPKCVSGMNDGPHVPHAYIFCTPLACREGLHEGIDYITMAPVSTQLWLLMHSSNTSLRGLLGTFSWCLAWCLHHSSERDLSPGAVLAPKHAHLSVCYDHYSSSACWSRSIGTMSTLSCTYQHGGCTPMHEGGLSSFPWYMHPCMAACCVS